MLVDFSTFYWIEDKDKQWYMGVVGTVVLVEIRKYDAINDVSFLHGYKDLVKGFGYVAYFNGIAPEYEDDTLGEYPVMYPIIGQSLNADELKMKSIRYVNTVFEADEPSKLEVAKAIINEEAALRNIVRKFINMSTVKGMIN